MRRCEEVVPLLGPLLDAALPDDDREWVEDHLKGCASCRDRQALIAAQGAALREVLAARADKADFTGFSDRVLARAAPDKSRAPLSVWGSEMGGTHPSASTPAGALPAARR